MPDRYGSCGALFFITKGGCQIHILYRRWLMLLGIHILHRDIIPSHSKKNQQVPSTFAIYFMYYFE